MVGREHIRRGKIDENGLLTAVSAGEVTVTAVSKIDDTVEDSVVVTILPEPVQTISVSSPRTVQIGHTIQINVSYSDDELAEGGVTWSVENTSGEATIDENGLLTGVSAGAVTVMATANADTSVKDSVVISVVPETSGASVREKLNFNRDWKFIRQDVQGAEATDANDAYWFNVGLPHDFSIPYWQETSHYTGYGWYRKSFTVEPDWAGSELSLDFEGVFHTAEIYVNGVRAGMLEGGYTGFEIDITDYVQPGENVVAIRVNNIWNPRLAPRATKRFRRQHGAGRFKHGCRGDRAGSAGSCRRRNLQLRQDERLYPEPSLVESGRSVSL